MRSLRPYRALISSLILCSLALLLMAGYAAAQGGSTPTYSGGDACLSCHRGITRSHVSSLHALALQPYDAAGGDAVMLADFSSGEAVRTVLFPGEDAERPFTEADIAYIIGAGRYAQRYVTEATDGTLYVLPAEWNTVSGEWLAFELAASWPDAGYNFAQNCAYCHTAGFDHETLNWVDDGVQCEACHGPGSEHIALAESAGLRPPADELAAVRESIFNQPDPQMCGQCHSRGTASDGSPYPVGYLPGGETALLDAGVYTLFAPDEADTVHYWRTGHAAEPNMQFNEWVLSAHADSPQALQEFDYASDDCLRCHSGDYIYNQRVLGWFADGSLDGMPPEPVTLDSAEFGITCQTCHNPHAGDEHAFLLVEDSYTLCAECHSNAGIEGHVHHPNREMFEGLSLDEALPGIPSAHFTTQDGPDCQSCHMARLPISEDTRVSHALLTVPADAPDALQAAAGCVSCHTDFTSEQIAQFITDVQGGIQVRLEAAQSAATEDDPAWIGVALDIIDGDGSLGLHNYPYTAALLGAAENALGLVDTNGENGEEESAPDWVSLPLVGRVEGLTWPGLAGGGLGFLVLLMVGLGLLRRGGARTFTGIVLLLGAVILVGWLIALLIPSFQPVQAASGEDGYCLLCHSGDSTFTLADGNVLSLGVDPAVVAASVHGTDSSTGYMGCLDCHGADAFPHDPAPTSLRDYRVAMSDVCADCHADSLDHYEDVLARNIVVGCADCHGAHDVRPASELGRTPVPAPPEEFGAEE